MQISKFTLKQIEVFYTAAQALNLSRTASMLNLTPPAVNKHIRNLEDICKTPLFALSGKQIYLTASGEQLFYTVKSFMESVQQLQNCMGNLQLDEQTSIKISITSTFQSYFFPFITQFNRQYPHIRLQLSVVNWSQQHEQIEQADFDAIIIGDPVSRNRQYSRVLLNRFRFVLVAAPTHRLRNRSFAVDDLRQEQFITSSSSSPSQSEQNKLFKKWNIKQPSILLDSYGAVVTAVKAELGIALLPDLIVERDISENQLVALDYQFKTPVFPLFCFIRKHRQASPEVTCWQTFLESAFVCDAG